MKALILGGNGFIGSHVVDKLLFAGHSVRVFDRNNERFRAPLSNVEYCLAGFEDTQALARALDGIDVVFHLISTTLPSTSNKDPLYDVESNLINTLKLLNLMREKKVHRIVYLSSGGTVYGIPKSFPISETHTLNPICSYGVVKVAIEKYLHMYRHLYGINYVILRASNPYGERQINTGIQGVIGTFIGKVLAGDSIEIWGDGSIVRDFIDVEDLATLCALVGDSQHSGTFNAGSGLGHSINEIVSVIETVSGEEINSNYQLGRVYDVSRVVLDIRKAKATFSWDPTVSLQQGIAKTWFWSRHADA